MKTACGSESPRLLLSLRGSLPTLLSPFAGTLSIEKLHVPIKGIPHLGLDTTSFVADVQVEEY